MSKRNILLLVIVFFIVCLIERGKTVLGESSDDTEVVIVATDPFISDMPEGYTPGHLRALLTKISSDVLAVEAPVNVTDPWKFAPLDLSQITRPWAQQHHLEVIPVGWDESEYQLRLSRMVQTFQQQGSLLAYQKIEQDFKALTTRKYSYTCEYMNNEEAQKLWRDYHAELHNLYNKDTPWEDWNKKILDNIVTLCRQYKGKRVAVIFGGAHYYYLYDHLIAQKEVRVIPASNFFPLSSEEVQAETYPVDYLKALRLLNVDLGTVSNDIRNRLESSLNKIKEFPELENDYHLFRGKFLLHSFQPEQAVLEFQKIAQLEDSVISLFDNQSRLKEKGLVYIAIAKILMKKNSEAESDLQSIIKESNVSEETKQWAQKLLRNLQSNRR